MAKFNAYGFKAIDDNGDEIATGKVLALSYQSAWGKAVAEAFDAIPANTGAILAIVEVWREHNPSESHG